MSVKRMDGSSGVVAPQAANGNTDAAGASSQAASATPAPNTVDARRESAFQTGGSERFKLKDGSATPKPLPEPLTVTAGNSAGTLGVTSPDAQAAISTSLQYLTRGDSAEQGSAGQGAAASAASADQFKARSVDKDSLGETHVRLDRTLNGIPVFGEQAITHLDPKGAVTSVSGNARALVAPEGDSLGSTPALSDTDAIAKATTAFQSDTKSTPTAPGTASLVYYPSKDGTLTKAYQVKIASSDPKTRPYRMNYFVDASTGGILKSFNTIDGFDLNGKVRPEQAAALSAANAASTPTSDAGVTPSLVDGVNSDPVNFSLGVSPFLITPSFQWTDSTLTVDQDLDLSKLQAGVNILAQNTGDVGIKLTSPSGKTVMLKQPGEGGSSDDVKQGFDLSKDFAGESALGDWTLSVMLNGNADPGYNGVLDWNLSGTGKTKDTADTTTKVASISPNTLVKASGTTSAVKFNDDFPLAWGRLNIDLDGAPAASQVVTLTSPSGKSVTMPTAQLQTDDLRASLPLDGFAGESTKGTWYLTVTDQSGSGTAHLNSWSLEAKDKAPPPPPPPVPGKGESEYSGEVDLATAKLPDGSYTLKDSSRGNGATYDAKHGGGRGTGSLFKDANNIWGEASDDAGEKAAVDAHFGMANTWDFYKNKLGRNSIDGNGEALNSYVHVKNQYVNAFWDGQQMNYGDGDGTNSSPLTTLDIAGHEISHGLTERTANLIYSGEPGGLNEAWSDIMGKSAQWTAAQANPNVPFSWGVGEQMWTPNIKGDALRYMDDPTRDNAEGGASVDNYSKYVDGLDVHYSSGIANNAFVLAVQGGTNKTSGQNVKTGIGMDKAMQAFSRAELVYMTPNTTFQEAAADCVKASDDLFGAGSDESKTIAAAWNAVGLKV